MNIEKYISASDLKRRGWTSGLIKKLMPLSDEQLPNPHYPSAKPMKMYFLDRVLMIESGREFIRLSQKSIKQSNILTQCFTKKRDALVGLVTMIEIPDFRVSEKDLLKKALLEVHMSSELKNLSKEAILAKQKMVAIDILMEMQDQVLWVLDGFYQHQGVCDARQILRRRILAKVISTFPSLSDEALSRAIEENGDV